MRTERRIIDSIILFNPLIYGLQELIDREQQQVIDDLASPAQKVVKKLFELDNRRIDLCNLNVLYAFIERALDERFGLFRSCIFGGIPADAGSYSAAITAIKSAGYTMERVNNEFDYLFKLIKRKPKRAVSSGVLGLSRQGRELGIQN